MKEAAIEKRLVDAFKKRGGWALKLPTSLVRGLPDRLCLPGGGRAYFVELKAPGKAPRRDQLFIHKRLEALGFSVFIIDTPEGVDDFVGAVFNPL